MNKFEFLNGTKIAEFHMLKLYPSSALNRDDAGEQKTAYYNGSLRNRISSQCYKRALRTSDTFSEVFQKTGIRTRRMPEYVAEKLKEKLELDEKAVLYFQIILAGENPDPKKKTKTEKNLEEGKHAVTPAIAFYSEEELAEIVNICTDMYQNLKEPKEKSLSDITLKSIQDRMRKKIHPMTVDVAAFGRMVTDNTLKPVEGALQFAQILSTNAAIKESDYFIACDDLVKGDTTEDNGGAMLGDIDYDSACYYIHAVADMEQFTENLKDCENTEELVKALPANLVEAMSYTDPSARQNTFEAHVLPEIIYVELKNRKRPLNRMKAFSKPCNKDVVRTSVNALVDNIDLMNEKADLSISHSVWYCEDEGNGFNVPKNVTIASSIMELEKILDDWMHS